MQAYTLRKAEAEDAGAILDLIHALAEYEKEPDSVECTREDILRDGFGERPIFECILAEVNHLPVGLALYYFNWSTWRGAPTLYLEDLFVVPEHRGKGIGLGLFSKLAEIAVDRRCRRFEFEVLDWNQLARDFYHGLGAFHKEGWLPYRLEGEALVKLAKR